MAGTSELLADARNATAPRQDRPDAEAPIEQSDNSLVRMINRMIIEAHREGVSDIHIESYPGREKIRIRFRKDGLLLHLPGAAAELPQRDDRAHQDHVRPGHQRSAASRRTARSTSPSTRRSTASSCAWPPFPPTTAWKTW
jgi:hypothetical protein